ncbi:hypothetical protein FP2506_15359 [Fulvimarina pelagi HTCC2506]|uniref:C-type lysozyme inhibitor domain-containing protein n=1 Tax=Fulvimarina pelagi HTCC2506 TaxID=314231 RepID=Q0G3K8_9HYPH|nr:MliC family protein [Fulvimarina pelagi]EAU41823.1 hypothetical protein FP2506_15359 [Fulvimarina pelagi HTCC2506]
MRIATEMKTIGGLAALLTLVLSGSAAAQTAEEITIQVTGPVDRQEITYACQDDQMETPARITVDYINLPNGNLAIVPVAGRPTVFALTLANSGSKYVSKSLVWWTRGNRGDLYDELRGGVEEAYVCRVVKD